jgi:glutamyl-tRNA reductase
VAQLTSLSFDYPAVAAERRAALSFPVVEDAHARLMTAGHRAFLLSTCLRIEIVWDGDAENISEILASLYEDESLSRLGEIRSNEAAFLHLCRVAAGLDSPLIGEPEVLGQFRRAVAACHPLPTERLGRVLEAAIGIGRSARRLLCETPRGSLAALAAKEARPAGQVAVLGGGAMARAAVEQLEGTDVTVFTRRPGKVAGREPVPWERMIDAFSSYPAVISTVPGITPLLGEGDFARVTARRTEPLLLIDLGMPPGFPRPQAAAPVNYLGVDEIAATANGGLSKEAEDFVAQSSNASWHRLTAPDRVGAVIAAMVQKAETVVSEEVERFAARLSAADHPEQVLRQTAHTVARRIMHSPISFVGSAERGSEVVDLVAEAFGIDDD